MIKDVAVSKGIYLVTRYFDGRIKYGFVTDIVTNQRMFEQRRVARDVPEQRRITDRRSLGEILIYVDKYVSVTDIAIQNGDNWIFPTMISTRYQASQIGIVCASIHVDYETCSRRGIAMIESRARVSPEVDLLTVPLRQPVLAPIIINANISLG